MSGEDRTARVDDVSFAAMVRLATERF